MVILNVANRIKSEKRMKKLEISKIYNNSVIVPRLKLLYGDFSSYVRSTRKFHGKIREMYFYNKIMKKKNCSTLLVIYPSAIDKYTRVPNDCGPESCKLNQIRETYEET